MWEGLPCRDRFRTEGLVTHPDMPAGLSAEAGVVRYHSDDAGVV